MRVTRSGLLGISLAALAIMQPLPTALSQSGIGGCRLERVENPSREVLRCPNGVSIIAERATRFEIRDRDGNGSADAVTLNRRALLLEVPDGANPNAFQVITPQAIAATYEIACDEYGAQGINPLALWDLHWVKELDDEGFIDALLRRGQMTNREL